MFWKAIDLIFNVLSVVFLLALLVYLPIRWRRFKRERNDFLDKQRKMEGVFKPASKTTC